MDPSGAVSTGTLATMWRSVYRKAADAAEARLGALLGDHVQQRHGQRALVVVLDGGGATVAAGVKCDLELPWAFRVEGWALYAAASGSLDVDLLTSAGLATFPGDLVSICAAAPPFVSGAQKARSDDLSLWTATALPRGSVLRVVVTGATAIQVATLTLFVRAL